MDSRFNSGQSNKDRRVATQRHVGHLFRQSVVWRDDRMHVLQNACMQTAKQTGCFMVWQQMGHFNALPKFIMCLTRSVTVSVTHVMCSASCAAASSSTTTSSAADSFASESFISLRLLSLVEDVTGGGEVSSSSLLFTMVDVVFLVRMLLWLLVLVLNSTVCIVRVLSTCCPMYSRCSRKTNVRAEPPTSTVSDSVSRHVGLEISGAQCQEHPRIYLV